MIRQVRLRPIAKKEFDEAVDWFEEKQIGLGISFTDAVNNDIQKALSRCKGSFCQWLSLSKILPRTKGRKH